MLARYVDVDSYVSSSSLDRISEQKKKRRKKRKKKEEEKKHPKSRPLWRLAGDNAYMHTQSNIKQQSFLFLCRGRGLPATRAVKGCARG